jgi:hypothetical protein
MEPQKLKRIDDIIAELCGTCQSLQNVLTDDEQNDAAILYAIDSELFECSECGWWCEISEAAEDDGGEPFDPPVCQSCKG